MDKSKNNISSLSLRAALAISLAGVAFNSRAAIIDVPDDYASIQEAVDAAQSGDQILVEDGIYYENVIIDKPLWVMADGARVDIYNSYPAFTIAADDVRVSGFDIRSYNGGSAFEATGQGGIVMDSCSIYGGNIDLTFSMGATVTNIISGGASWGIRSMGNGYLGGTNDVIANNEVWASFVGISITDASVPVTVSSNSIYNCSYGFNIGDSTGVALVGNNIRNGESSANPLWLYSEFADCNIELSGNNVHAVNDPAIEVTAITLINEGFGTNVLDVSGHFNRFGASNAVAVIGSGTIVTDLTNNWWGKNSAPTSDVSLSPWLIMSVSPQSATQTNGSITISCNWSTNSASQNVSSLGQLPPSRDGLYWADSSGYLVDPILDNRVTMEISGGTSSVLYYPSANPGTVNAILDYQTLSVLINH
jgi:hypothetical protein